MRFGASIAALFAPRATVRHRDELAEPALADQFAVSFPILAAILVLRLSLGAPLTETANLALAALIAVNLIAALIFRSGRVYPAGAVLTFALWAAGTFISCTHPAVRESMAIVMLFPALMAFLVLPWRPALVLAVLSVSSIVVLQVQATTQGSAGNPTDRVLALAGSLLAVGDLTFVVRMGLIRATRRVLSTQDALSRSERELSSILQKTPDIIYRLDPEGRIRYVNDAVRRYGYDPSSMIGTQLLDYVHPGDFDLAQHRVNERRTADRSTRALEIRLLTREGRERVAEYTATPVFEEAVFLLEAEGLYEGGTGPRHFLGTQGIARDITDRKRLESQLQQAQKLEALGRLAGGIAHDFNNMLTVILGQAEIAKSDLEPANPASERIQEIRKVAERSADLTRQLLTFARKKESVLRTLDLNQAISERLGMLGRLIGENVTLRWKPSPGLWAVKLDPSHLDQVLVNLAVNARDAISDVGTLALTTENRVRPAAPPQRAGSGGPGEWVLLSVTDSGSGMSEDTLAHVFEPFFTTKEIGKGTGMGLATVYGIAQHAGGWVEVESRLGKGTTFQIYLPRAGEGVTPGTDAEETPLSAGGETVLVVDDEPGVLSTIRTILRRLGYEVLEAGSARDALAAAARCEERLSLLLTDVVMPEMSGHELYRKIAASHPGLRVVFMSGYSGGVVPSDGGDAPVPFLAKPFSIPQLSAKVREVLDEKPDETAPGLPVRHEGSK